MSPAAQFPFVIRDPTLGPASLSPLLPIELQGRSRVHVSGLLDTGASINVLPLSIGEQLGLDWSSQTTPVQLTGNMAALQARVVVVSAIVDSFSPVRLAFAWAQSNAIPVILGQVNFFLEFDVCFFRARECFEVRPKQKT